MKTWQDNIRHSANCAAATSDDPAPCICQRDETVAAIEGVVSAALATQDTKDRFGGCPFCMRIGTHDDWCQLGKLQAALDRLNALSGGASEKEDE